MAESTKTIRNLKLAAPVAHTTLRWLLFRFERDPRAHAHDSPRDPRERVRIRRAIREISETREMRANGILIFFPDR